MLQQLNCLHHGLEVLNTLFRHPQGQRVGSHLVEPLGDEVGREGLLEALLVLERVVQLRVRHGARLEPAVEDVLDALQRREARAPLRRNLDVVDEVPVQICHLQAATWWSVVTGRWCWHLTCGDTQTTAVRGLHHGTRASLMPRASCIVRLLRPSPHNITKLSLSPPSLECGAVQGVPATTSLHAAERPVGLGEGASLTSPGVRPSRQQNSCTPEADRLI